MMNEDDIKAIISDEMSNAQNDELVQIKRTAMGYYAGDLPAPSGIMGRSAVVSTDVADAVEWLLPNIVESLTGKAVKFQPMSAMDEDQSQLETDITHFAFSEDNNGYLNLYEAAKDALLTGVGIWKIYFDDTPERVVERYAGIDENQMQALLGDPMMEVTNVERSETDGISVTAARITRQGKVRVEAVPAEEFRVSDSADSLDLTEARFCAHTTRRTASDLLAMGYDPDVIDEASHDNLEREMDNYQTVSDLDDSQKLIVVTEAYLNIDLNEDGIGELCKVTYVGESDVSHILDIEEIAEIPFVAMSAMPVPHKFRGTSVYERLSQVQDTKTAVLRATLDAYYQQVNRIKVVTEGQVNLDDLLVNRPGGIIRAKGPNAVQELGGTFFGAESLQLLQYADTQKDARVGVSPDMAGQANLVGQESAHGVERLQSAKEMLVGLMIRSIAETGIRPAYRLIRDLMVRYQTATVPHKFRGQWMNISPADWGERSRMTVCVGTGTQEDQVKVASLQQLLGVQQGLMMNDPMNPLCDYSKIHNTLKSIINLTDIGESDQFLYDPQSPEGQQFGQMKQQQGQQQQQEAMQKEQTQLQFQKIQLDAQMQIANAESQKAQAAMANGQLKEQINALEAQLQSVKDAKDQDLKRAELQGKMALELTKLEVQAKADLSKQNEANKAPVQAVPAASSN